MRKKTVIRVLCSLASTPLATACDAEHETPNGSALSIARASRDTSIAYHPGMLYGRVTLVGGGSYEGRLRFGGDEEALWGNFFNGARTRNPWVERVPAEQFPTVTETVTVFGRKVFTFKEDVNMSRPFVARFGDIASIEAQEREINVTLKSGTAIRLNRNGADDLADGVRVWDASGIVDLEEKEIRKITFSGGPHPSPAPLPLHGTVRTSRGDFTGLIQWSREECLVSDTIVAITADAERALRFDEIRSITRPSRLRDSATIVLRDGSEVALPGKSQMTIGGNRTVPPIDRGIYVDDARYGRVLISWDAFQRADFSEGNSGPSYDDFAASRPLNGSVTTTSGRVITGRVVYDLDESETAETLDAERGGVNYSIPFGLIASITLPVGDRSAQPVIVKLQSGEELQLTPSGDLHSNNGGMLIFDQRDRAEYVPWNEIASIQFHY